MFCTIGVAFATLLLAMPAVVRAQVALADLYNVCDVSEHSGTSSGLQFRQHGRATSVADQFLWLYQVTVSRQSVHTCNFEPSCSNYARDILSGNSLLTACLRISDRLQRCHGLPGSEQYYARTGNGRLRDLP